MTTKEMSTPRFRTLDLSYIALFAVLMAVCSWIATPSTPISVPFTLQTFAVFAALVMLGGRRGLWAIVVYLMLGLVGAPVFAGFQGGAGILLGGTGGYLVGFIGSGLTYWLVTARAGNSLLVKAGACLLGLLVCYAIGTAWFMVFYTQTTGPISLMAALGWCVFPFVVPDLAKIALAIFLSRRLGKYLK